MRTTLNASRPPPNSRISLVGIKKVSTGFDPETFLTKTGVGKTVVNLKKKDAAFSQGDPANAVFYIQKGKVKLTVVSNAGKEAALGILGEGEFFGEGSLAGQPLRMGSTTY
jgi:CRP/FNR family cyclic AMP-dependent transcriptional regulator